jgi:hypothetical protein
MFISNFSIQARDEPGEVVFLPKAKQEIDNQTVFFRERGDPSTDKMFSINLRETGRGQEKGR